MEEVESDLVLVELHLVDGLLELVSLVLDHFLSLLDFFLLLLQLFDLLVYLLFHHLEEILMLYFELVHDSSEGFLKLVNFLVELLADLHLQLIIELLIHRNGLVVLLDLDDHLLNHLFHLFDFG